MAHGGRGRAAAAAGSRSVSPTRWSRRAGRPARRTHVPPRRAPQPLWRGLRRARPPHDVRRALATPRPCRGVEARGGGRRRRPRRRRPRGGAGRGRRRAPGRTRACGRRREAARPEAGGGEARPQGAGAGAGRAAPRRRELGGPVDDELDSSSSTRRRQAARGRRRGDRACDRAAIKRRRWRQSYTMSPPMPRTLHKHTLVRFDCAHCA